MKKLNTKVFLFLMASFFVQVDLKAQCGGECPVLLPYAYFNSNFQCVLDLNGVFSCLNLSSGASCVYNGFGCNEALSEPGDETPVPIELMYFRGEVTGKSNTIEWATATESNNMSQVVQRSLNGKNNWQEIAWVKPAGNTAEEQFYRIEDEAPLPLAYYRLKSVDFDGFTEYSNIIILERPGNGYGVVKVFPNPTQKDVSVFFELEKPGRVKTSLVDLTGRLVSDLTFIGEKGKGNLQLDLTELPKGAYFLIMDDGQNISRKKLIKN